MPDLLPGTFGSDLGYFQIPAGSVTPAATIATMLAALGSPAVIPPGALGALLQAEAQNIRWRDDGTNPTATVGMILLSGQPPVWFSGAQMRAAKFLQATSGAILNISFYGRWNH